MHATEENYETCKEIIRLLHKRGISLAQSYAILDYVKVKIAQDTKVGEFIAFSHEEL
jgi:hypothetical protein|nr:MAG TPA: hypothetical protein [Caudoviricetes sp.]